MNHVLTGQEHLVLIILLTAFFIEGVLTGIVIYQLNTYLKKDSNKSLNNNNLKSKNYANRKSK